MALATFPIRVYDFLLFAYFFFLDKEKVTKRNQERKPTTVFCPHAHPGNGVKKRRFALFVHVPALLRVIIYCKYELKQRVSLSKRGGDEL